MVDAAKATAASPNINMYSGGGGEIYTFMYVCVVALDRKQHGQRTDPIELLHWEYSHTYSRAFRRPRALDRMAGRVAGASGYGC